MDATLTRPTDERQGLPPLPSSDLLAGQFVTIKNGDCRTVLKELPPESVQCVVTSPPYWGLRDYGHADQIGLEETPQAYVETMREVFAEVWRVLRDDGTLWLNLGDSYSGSGKGGNPDEGKQATNKGSQTIGTLYGKTGESARQAAVTNVSRRLCAEHGMKAKDLIGIPWRVALALQADGWYLRSDIIWHKPNPMPESMTDRPTRSHEYIFLMTKSPRYYYNAEAIKEPSVEVDWQSRLTRDSDKSTPPAERNGIRKRNDRFGGNKHNGETTKHSDGSIFTGSEDRNKRDVWTVTTSPYPDAHFATFPPDLIKPCILAGTKPGDVVLDPFGGSGTTGKVALELGRRAVLVELNPEYTKLCEQRCTTTRGLPLAC
jgi:DNA modification methylase